MKRKEIGILCYFILLCLLILVSLSPKLILSLYFIFEFLYSLHYACNTQNVVCVHSIKLLTGILLSFFLSEDYV